MPTLIEQARVIRDRAKSQPVGRLPLAQFAGSRRVVRIYSEVLACEIFLAADNALLLDTGSRQVYRARELMQLLHCSQDGLRLLHEVKTCFGAEIGPETLNKPG